MKEPYFPLYGGDVMADMSLSSSELHAIGGWLYLMIACWNSPIRGALLKADGTAPKAGDEVARLVSRPWREMKRAIDELVKNSAFRWVTEEVRAARPDLAGVPLGALFHSRMRRAAYVSAHRASAGSKGKPGSKNGNKSANKTGNKIQNKKETNAGLEWNGSSLEEGGAGGEPLVDSFGRRIETPESTNPHVPTTQELAQLREDNGL